MGERGYILLQKILGTHQPFKSAAFLDHQCKQIPISDWPIAFSIISVPCIFIFFSTITTFDWLMLYAETEMATIEKDQNKILVACFQQFLHTEQFWCNICVCGCITAGRMADSSYDDSERDVEQLTAVADATKVQKYLKKITQTFFDEEDFVNTLQPLDSAFADPANVELVKRFIEDAQVRTMVVRGIANKGECQLHSDSVPL